MVETQTKTRVVSGKPIGSNELSKLIQQYGEYALRAHPELGEEFGIGALRERPNGNGSGRAAGTGEVEEP